MRVVALDTVHVPFQHRMVLWQIELGVGLKMAVEAGRSVLAGIDDELSAPAPYLNVFATGAVTRFAAALSSYCCARKVDAGMRAGGEATHIIGVAVEAGAISNKSGTRYGWGAQYRTLQR